MNIIALAESCKASNEMVAAHACLKLNVNVATDLATLFDTLRIGIMDMVDAAATTWGARRRSRRPMKPRPWDR